MDMTLKNKRKSYSLTFDEPKTVFLVWRLLENAEPLFFKQITDTVFIFSNLQYIQPGPHPGGYTIFCSRFGGHIYGWGYVRNHSCSESLFETILDTLLVATVLKALYLPVQEL